MPLIYLARLSLESGVVGNLEFTWNWSNYSEALSLYDTQFVRSFVYAGAATLLSLVIAYPLAYAIAFKAGRWRNVMLFAVVAPFFTTYLIRTIAWETILSDESPVTEILHAIGLAPGGHVLATSGAVIAGLTYNFLPFMILPIYASLERIDVRLIEAAKDLYSSATQGFLRVTLPLSAPGIIAGTLLTFIPAAGDYVNAQFLGGAGNRMIGNVIQSLYLTPGRLSVGGGALLRADGADHVRGRHLHPLCRLGGADGGGGEMSGAWRWLREHAVNIVAAMVVVYLMIPIAVILLFSFNDPQGRYNYTWVGFTLYHWGHAFSRPELTEALLTSLKLALLATVISTIVGTLMALALVRHQFFGRRMANFLIVIPMATPEVVMGAALLSFFLILGSPSLGFQTLLIAHVMFCISFVVVVVRSRLIGFDRNLEEAAKDLGANAFATFRLVTLPLIVPGIFGAAMLAFALSIDDFVISNFNSGTTVTFPLYIYGAAQRGIPVEVNVIAMMLFGVTVLAMGLVTWQQRRAEQMAEVRPEQESVPISGRPSGATA